MDKDFEAVVLSACRTPIGAFGGALKDISAVDLGAIWHPWDQSGEL